MHGYTHMKHASQVPYIALWRVFTLEAESNAPQLLQLLENPVLRAFSAQHIQVLEHQLNYVVCMFWHKNRDGTVILQFIKGVRTLTMQSVNICIMK